MTYRAVGFLHTEKVMGTVYGFANEVKMISGMIFSVECLESYFADDASQKITAGSGEENDSHLRAQLTYIEGYGGYLRKTSADGVLRKEL